MEQDRLVVIGASAGGVDAMLRLAQNLPTAFPSPILLVQHIGIHRSQLPELLAARGPNRAVHAANGMVLEKGTIHVAPPDRHMIIEDSRVFLSHGPKENHARPAIDPLFRSAALAAGPAVVGVILTGMLDDGTAGLQAIKECGGTAVVQDPREAPEPSMPLSALAHVAVDHVATIEQMGPLLYELVPQATTQPPGEQPFAIRQEHLIMKGVNAMDALMQIGSPSALSCPDCGGVLFELRDRRPPRYRCHTGHGYTLRTLASVQEGVTDRALWTSLRALQEKDAMLRKLSETQEVGNPAAALDARREAGAVAEAIQALRRLVELTPVPTAFDVAKPVDVNPTEGS